MDALTLSASADAYRPMSDPDEAVACATEAARILSLLGQETRFLALYHLAIHDELTVNEMADAVKISQSALSHHLSKLRRDRLVTFRRDAQHLYYRIADPRVARLIRIFRQPPSTALSSVPAS
ncbi:MAG: metalloregulator ArsR/SmtB family transcription factor [Xanthobacteraceae bacterium]